MDTTTLNKITTFTDKKVVKFLAQHEEFHDDFVDMKFRYVDNGGDGLLHMEFSIDDLETIHTMKYGGSSGIAMVLCTELEPCYEDEDGNEREYADDEWIDFMVSFKMYCEIFNWVDSTRFEDETGADITETIKKHPKTFRKSRRDVYKKNGWLFNKNGWL